MGTIEHGQKDASQIKLDTLARIQDLLLSMDMKLTRARNRGPRYDKRTEMRIRRASESLDAIREEIIYVFDG